MYGGAAPVSLPVYYFLRQRSLVYSDCSILTYLPTENGSVGLKSDVKKEGNAHYSYLRKMTMARIIYCFASTNKAKIDYLFIFYNNFRLPLYCINKYSLFLFDTMHLRKHCDSRQ